MALDVALVGSGLPRSVGLVGCGKRKRITEGGVPARYLYIGNLFSMSISLALATADDVHILSALHGLVEPSRKLAPYDMSMTQLVASERRDWGRRVVASLKAAYPLTPIRIVFYAGGSYTRPIVEALNAEASYWSYEDPMKGLDLFQRLAWLKAEAGQVDPHS